MPEHYIRLLTTIKFTPKQKRAWYRVVEKFLTADNHPEHENFVDNMISQRDEFKGDDDFPYVYVVYLDKKLDYDTAEKIVALWNDIYPLDYEIETSADLEDSCSCYDCDDIEIDDEMYEEIQRRASKFLHNRWVEEQVRQGWRYGLRTNESSKTSPRMRDWDSLREEYRRELSMDRDQATKFFKTYPHLFV